MIFSNIIFPAEKVTKKSSKKVAIELESSGPSGYGLACLLNSKILSVQYETSKPKKEIIIPSGFKFA